MNTWHESLASCSAPQENQYNVTAIFPPPEPAVEDEQDEEWARDDGAEGLRGVGDGSGIIGEEGDAGDYRTHRDEREDYGYDTGRGRTAGDSHLGQAERQRCRDDYYY